MLANRISFRNRLVKPKSSREPNKRYDWSPGLIIKMWNSRLDKEEPQGRCSSGPKKRTLSGMLATKPSLDKKRFVSVEGVKIVNQSISVQNCEFRIRLKEKKTLKAILPKVEHQPC